MAEWLSLAVSPARVYQICVKSRLKYSCLADLFETHGLAEVEEDILEGEEDEDGGTEEVLGLGGPTGFSVNPARDLEPRIAHALLLIPGKGGSEWYYAWIPVTAALAGGAVGAGLFMAINTGIWPSTT